MCAPLDPYVIMATKDMADHTVEHSKAVSDLERQQPIRDTLQALLVSQSAASSGTSPEYQAAFTRAYPNLMTSCQLLLQWKLLEDHLTSVIGQICRTLCTCTQLEGSMRPHPMGKLYDIALKHRNHVSTTTSYPLPTTSSSPYKPNIGYTLLLQTISYILVFVETAGNPSSFKCSEEYPDNLPPVEDWVWDSLHSMV